MSDEMKKIEDKKVALVENYGIASVSENKEAGEITISCQYGQKVVLPAKVAEKRLKKQLSAFRSGDEVPASQSLGNKTTTGKKSRQRTKAQIINEDGITGVAQRGDGVVAVNTTSGVKVLFSKEEDLPKDVKDLLDGVTKTESAAKSKPKPESKKDDSSKSKKEDDSSKSEKEEKEKE